MEDRKRLEQDIYERAARGRRVPPEEIHQHGAALIDPTIRRPYLDFETTVRDNTRPGHRVLDIGAGTGIHSLAAATRSASLFATDIAPSALGIALQRARNNAVALSAVAADAERLPFADHSFDVVTSAGSLYCLDFQRFSQELLRILQPGGIWVAVDSYDQNPLYRLNRYVGFLRGRRSRMAVTNIPNAETIAQVRRLFTDVETRFYGSLVPLAPLLRGMLGAEGAGRVLDRADSLLGHPAALAFKFVMVARKPPRETASAGMSA